MIKNIFPTKIWEATYPGYNKEETVKIFDAFQKKKGTHKLNRNIIANSTVGIFPAPPFTLSTVDEKEKEYTPEYKSVQKDLPELFMWINKQIAKYHKHLGYQNPERYQIAGAWTTSADKDDYLVLHNHNPRATAGVFYVDAEPDRGNLYLLNPNEMVMGKDVYQSGYDFPDKWYEFSVQSGRLILFPGYLYHQAAENPTNDKRKTISFDVM